MIQAFYTEFFGTWDGTEGGKGSADDNQWQIYNVTENHSIPPSAVLEIVCVNEYNIAEYNIGVRSTASSSQTDSFRRIQLAEAENGDNYVTMHVQLDSSGILQYFVEHFDRLHFDILGYWQGCEYTDAFDEFDPSAPSGWENYALNQHGVGSGQISEIVMSNIADAVDHTLGVRASGSVIDRRFEIKEAEGGGEECLSVLVSPSGSTAGINIWSSNIADCSFRLVGYFSVPPADYQEVDVIFPTPEIQSSWLDLDVGASGIPSNVLAQFIIGQRFFDAITVGMRETNSIIHDRKLILDRQDTDLTAPSWGGIHSNVDNDGKLEYYCDDLSDAPFYKIIGYWENFINVETPFPENNNIDLFIRGLNPNAHYIESFTGDWSPSITDGSWQTIDMSVYNYEPNTVAEIIMRQQHWDTAAWLGARSGDSNLQRSFLLRDSYDGFFETDCITWNVSLDVNAKFECSSSGNPNYDDSFGLGYWVGCKYVELFEIFQANVQSGWVNHNLSSYGVPSGKIAEIVIASFDEDLPQSGGIRQVGSIIDRVIEINGLRSNWDPNPGGVDVISMFVNTSGSDSTIQVYAGNSGLMDFTVVGYWDVAPGDYTESMTVITPNTIINGWRRLNLYTDYSIPSGAVVDIHLGNYKYNAQNTLGVREIDPKLSQTDSEDRFIPNRRIILRETNDTEPSGFGVDVVRMHVNSINGYAEFYHSQNNPNTRIWALGYWDNFRLITNEINNQINLFTLGQKTFQESGILFIQGNEIFQSSGDLLIHGNDIISSSGNLFIHGQDTIEASGNLYIYNSNIYRTDAEFSTDYPSGLLCYTTGSGIIPASSVLPPLLFMHGHDIISNSGTSLFTTSHESIFESGNLFLKTPEPSNEQITFFINGHNFFSTNDDYPSGMLLRIDKSHETFHESNNLFLMSPTPYSGTINMYIQAGIFDPPVDLFTLGYINYNAETNLYVNANKSINKTCPLWIGPLRSWENWTLYLKTEDNNINHTANLFTHGFEPSVSGANQTFDNMRLYLEAVDADHPYTAGGTENWTMFLKVSSGNPINNNTWTMFLKADFTTSAICNLYTYGHASGELPHGNEFSDSVGLICSINPDDPTRIGFIPFSSNIDPWTLFLKGDPGHFNTIYLYISGAAPISLFASGSLFIEGLFEQEVIQASLYLMGISGIFDNGPNGLSLFLNADILVYNTSGNLYAHGY